MIVRYFWRTAIASAWWTRRTAVRFGNVQVRALIVTRSMTVPSYVGI